MCLVAALSELVTHFPCSGFLGFETFPLDVVVNPIELLDEGVELLLLLPKGCLMGEDARLTLALVLFFLVGDSMSPLPLSFLVALP